MNTGSSHRQPAAMHRLMRGMWRTAPLLCLAHGLSWDLFNLLGLVPGLVVSRALNRLDTDPDAGLLRAVLMLAALAVVGTVLILIAGRLEIRMRFHMSGLVRTNLLRDLLRRPGALPLPYSSGQIISRFRDDAYAAEDAMDWTDEIVVHLLIGIGALVALAMIDIGITIAVTIPLVLVVLVTWIAGPRLIRYRQASSQATADLTGLIGSLLAAAPQLQTAGSEADAVARIAVLNRERRRATITDAVAGRGVDALAGILTAIAIGLAMLLATNHLRSGALPVGDFALFLLWTGFLSDLTINLGRYLAFMRQAKVGFERMDALLDDAPAETLVAPTPLFVATPLDRPETPTDSLAEPFRQLEIRGLTASYPGSVDTLTGGIRKIDLCIKRGTLTVVTGRVGAGKTTLLRAVTGLLPVQAGEIWWNGQLVQDPVREMEPPRIGYTPQAPRLFSMTLRDNILLGEPAVESVLMRALEDSVLMPDLVRFPDGLETTVGARGLRLSGGQLQRAAAARMLVREPELLVIDDLSSALDVETERLLWERLLARPGSTCLAVSHRRAALQRADQIIVLDRGEIVARGRLADLLGSSPLLRELWQKAGDG